VPRSAVPQAGCRWGVAMHPAGLASVRAAASAMATGSAGRVRPASSPSSNPGAAPSPAVHHGLPCLHALGHGGAGAADGVGHEKVVNGRHQRRGADGAGRGGGLPHLQGSSQTRGDLFGNSRLLDCAVCGCACATTPSHSWCLVPVVEKLRSQDQAPAVPALLHWVPVCFRTPRCGSTASGTTTAGVWAPQLLVGRTSYKLPEVPTASACPPLQDTPLPPRPPRPPPLPARPPAR